MNELLGLIPYKFLMAAYTFLPALIVLSFGGGAVEVGLIGAVGQFGLFLAPLFWSRFSTVTSHRRLMAFGYLSMFFGFLILSTHKLIYFAVFFIAFFPTSIYFAAMSEAKRRKGDLGEILGKIEQFCGISWAFGYLTAFLVIQMIAPTAFAVILAGLALSSLPLVAIAIEEPNVVGVVKDGVQELKEFEMWLITQLGKFKITKFHFEADIKAIYLYIFGIVFSISSALMYAQMPTLFNSVFNVGSFVYLAFFIESLTSAAFYRIAGSLKDKSFVVGYGVRFFAFIALFFAIVKQSMLSLLIFFFLIGISWSFIMIFFEYVGLKMGEEILGTMLALRVLAIAIGSAFSGFIVDWIGFLNMFILSMIIFIPTIVLYIDFEKATPKRARKHRG